jgi:helix-turn-helix protein
MTELPANPETSAEVPLQLEQPVAPGGQRLLTEEEAAGFLRVSREAILRLKRDEVDPIPCYKVGRRYLYDPKEVLRWARRRADRVHRSLRLGL